MTLAAFFNFRQAHEWTQTFQADQANYIRRKVSDFPAVAGMIGRRYAETAARHSYIKANQEIRDIPARLRREDLNLAASDEELCAWAEAKAKTGAQLVSEAERTDDADKLADMLERVQQLAARYGFEIPDAEKVGILPAMRRTADAAWWRRQARRAAAQEVEALAVAMRRVNKAREIYCSDLTVTRRQGQRVRNRKYLEATTATNEEGQEYTLAELSDLSVSNPRLMRMEWMTRLAGFDRVAVMLGHARELWTATAPAECHPWTTAGGSLRENPKWEKAGRPSARAVMDLMCKAWAGFRAWAGRRMMKVYGMRVVEANHDGTPHWHLAVYFPKHWQGDTRRAASPRLRAAFRRYFLGDMSNYNTHEIAAAKAHRTDFKEVWEGHSAAGYLAKYIAKALPAEDAADMLQADLYGNAITESAERVNAWKSCHRIRQFQQIGGPSVTVWRELRRAMANEAAQCDLLDAPEIIQDTAKAADEHDWAAFVMLMGGPTVGREEMLIRPGYWQEHDADTGEVIGRPLTRYGEIPKGRVFGIDWQTGQVLTRIHTWEVKASKPAAAPVESTRDIARETRDAMRRNPPEWSPWSVVEEIRHRRALPEDGLFFSGATAPPWTRVNNCTQVEGLEKWD